MKRQAGEKTTQFEVRTKGVKTFRRCGIEFGEAPTVVERSGLSPEQVVELLNTDALSVVEMAPPALASAPKAPEAKGK